MDHDCSGTISKTELVASTKNDPDIAAQMSALGVERRDVGTVFDLMDTSGSGEVSYIDLVTSLHRLRSHDPLQCTIVTVQQLSRLHETFSDSLGVGLCGAGDAVEKETCPNEQGPVDTAAPVGLEGARSTKGTPIAPALEICHLKSLGTELKLILREAQEQVEAQRMLTESLHACVHSSPGFHNLTDCDFADDVVAWGRTALDHTD